MEDVIQFGDCIEVSEEHAPIYLFRLRRTASDPEFFRYLEYATALHAKQRPFAMVYDVTTANMATPKQRAAQADMLKRNALLTRRYCAGVAFVLASPMVRGVLTAILWLQPMACPYRVVSDVDVGMHWARSELDRMLGAVGPSLQGS